MTPDIATLLPHQGNARMLERVERWSEQELVALTTTHRSPDNPLRREGRLSAVHLAEYGAQAMALHGALRDEAAGKATQPALLVAVRDFRMHRDYLEDLPGELRVVATAQTILESGWQYRFEVTHEGELIASGRVSAIATARVAS